MCVLAFAHGPAIRGPRDVRPATGGGLVFVAAANRDEFRGRPADPLAVWSPGDVAAGRDRTAGGTWLAVGSGGRFAAVTNIREPGRTMQGAPSRGDLPLGFVRGHRSAAEYAEACTSRGQSYNGFNLVCRDADAVWVCSNRDMPRPRELAPGRHGFSNGPAAASWPKSDRIEAALAGLSPSMSDAEITRLLLSALRDDTPVLEGPLPDTGLDPEVERSLSAPFVSLPDYGTRCSTVVILREGGGGLITECPYDEAGVAQDARSLRLVDGRFEVASAVSPEARGPQPGS